MDKTYLPDLISGLEQELLRLGYTKGSMAFYRRQKHRRAVWSVWSGISISTMRCCGVISSIRKY